MYETPQQKRHLEALRYHRMEQEREHRVLQEESGLPIPRSLRDLQPGQLYEERNKMLHLIIGWRTTPAQGLLVHSGSSINTKILSHHYDFDQEYYPSGFTWNSLRRIQLLIPVRP